MEGESWGIIAKLSSLRLPQRVERRVPAASAVPRIADQGDVQGMVIGLVPLADIDVNGSSGHVYPVGHSADKQTILLASALWAKVPA